MSEFRRPLKSLAVVTAMAALLVLGGCGRKGPLDPPPGASSATEPQANGGLTPPIMSPLGGSQTAGTDKTGPSQPPKRSFLLDPLLN